jgi:hypothetical protein
MNTEGSARLELDIDVYRDPLNGEFIGHCPVLDVYARGKTERKARCAAIDAVSVYVEHATIKGREHRCNSTK